MGSTFRLCHIYIFYFEENILNMCNYFVDIYIYTSPLHQEDRMENFKIFLVQYYNYHFATIIALLAILFALYTKCDTFLESLCQQLNFDIKHFRQYQYLCQNQCFQKNAFEIETFFWHFQAEITACTKMSISLLDSIARFNRKLF